jgi:hypothetical protein
MSLAFVAAQHQLDDSGCAADGTHLARSGAIKIVVFCLSRRCAKPLGNYKKHQE